MLNNKKEVVKVNQELKLEMKILLFKHLSVNTHTSVYFFQQKDLFIKLKLGKYQKDQLASKGKSLFNILTFKKPPINKFYNAFS